MGFTWVQDVSSGASIDSADIQEIRDNMDLVYDSPPCSEHDGAVQSTEDADQNGTYYVNEHGSYDSIDRSPYYLTENIGDKGSHNPSDETSDLVDDFGGNFPGDDSSYYTDYNSPYRASDDIPYDSGDLSGYNQSYYDVYYTGVGCGSYYSNDIP